MNNLHPRRYFFRGHATGVSAHIRRPEDQVLPIQACSSLPVTGGHHESQAGTCQLGKWISLESAKTTAHGDYADASDGVATTHGTVGFDAVPVVTTVTADVRNLVVLGRVRIGRAAFGATNRNPQTKEDPSIGLHDVVLEGVSIDDCPLAITLATDFFTKHDTRKKLADAHGAGLPTEHAAMFLHPNGSPNPTNRYPEAQGVARCTIVKQIAWAGKPHPDATIQGNAVTVPNFGKIYFGELFVEAKSRRVTMVRFQLGSSDGGEIDVSSGEPNGGTWPPDTNWP